MVRGASISIWLVLPYFCMFVLTYTVSNVAILCCISAWLGELGRRTRIDGAAHAVAFHRGDYMAAVMRGFLSYLAILTGFVVIGSGVDVFVTPTPASFVRLAAIVSLVGFLIGFNPSMFARFVESVAGKVVIQNHADGSAAAQMEGPARIQEIKRTITTSPDHTTEKLSADPVSANGLAKAAAANEIADKPAAIQPIIPSSVRGNGIASNSG